MNNSGLIIYYVTHVKRLLLCKSIHYFIISIVAPAHLLGSHSLFQDARDLQCNN